MHRCVSGISVGLAFYCRSWERESWCLNCWIMIARPLPALRAFGNIKHSRAMLVTHRLPKPTHLLQMVIHNQYHCDFSTFSSRPDFHSHSSFHVFALCANAGVGRVLYLIPFTAADARMPRNNKVSNLNLMLASPDRTKLCLSNPLKRG